MISKREASDALNASWRQKILLNGKHEWSFLDEYTFSDFKKDSSSPSFTCEAEGLVVKDNTSQAARLCITKHEDLKAHSACVCILGADGKVESLIDVTSMQVA